MKWLSWDHMYWRIISAAALCSRPADLRSQEVKEYTAGFVLSVTRIFLDSLRNQGLIENYVVEWRDSYLVIQVQENPVAHYTVHQYPRDLFSEEMMTVAGVMMV